MAPKTTTTISLYGDRTYTVALRVLAAQQGITVGKFIRNLIDEKYGKDIEKVIGSFFESGIPQTEYHKRKQKGA